MFLNPILPAHTNTTTIKSSTSAMSKTPTPNLKTYLVCIGPLFWSRQSPLMQPCRWRHAHEVALAHTSARSSELEG